MIEATECSTTEAIVCLCILGMPFQVCRRITWKHVNIFYNDNFHVLSPVSECGHIYISRCLMSVSFLKGAGSRDITATKHARGNAIGNKCT